MSLDIEAQNNSEDSELRSDTMCDTTTTSSQLSRHEKTAASIPYMAKAAVLALCNHNHNLSTFQDPEDCTVSIIYVLLLIEIIKA